MKSRIELHRKFHDKTYRHAYAASFLNSYLASQIRTLRQAKNLSQGGLARLVKTKQPRISLLESADNSNWNLAQLKKLAKVFDVALVVRFESFSNLVLEIEGFSRQSLARPSFDEDPTFTSDVFVEQPTRKFYGSGYIELGEPSVFASALSTVPTQTTASGAAYEVKAFRANLRTPWERLMLESLPFIAGGR